MEISPEYAVQMHGIMETFGPLCVLSQVHLDVKKGPIHVTLGENSVGKNTLMNALYGLYQADVGEIFSNGEKVVIKNPNDAIARGIGMVHQHFMLVDNSTAMENIILDKEATGQFGVLDTKKAHENVLKIVREYGLEVDPGTEIEDVSVGMQQRVETLEASYRGADILTLDEPIAVLTPQEIGGLIEIIRGLAESGETTIIVTHKLKEIRSSSDVCTTIRRGQYTDIFPIHNVSEKESAAKMIGHQIRLAVDKAPAEPDEVVSKIRNLTVKGERGLEAVKSLSLHVRRDEIVGIAGVDGDDQKELAETITRLTRVESGTIWTNGTEVRNTTPRNVIEHKISTTREDHQHRGLVMPFTVAGNTVLKKYCNNQFSRRGMLLLDKIIALAKCLVEDCDIRPADCKGHPARGFSGSNQQEMIIAGEISDDPDLLIAAQPARGLDVGTIEYVHKMPVQECDKGKGILLVSLELGGILNMADAVCVIYGGAITGTFTQEGADENTVEPLMTGGKWNGNVG